MPVLLYGSENWVLTDVLMERLEAFQAELVKRVLKWPKHHSNTACNCCFGCSYNEMQGPDEEAGISAESDGWRLRRSEWECYAGIV